MLEKVPKALKNPELRDKFQVGQIVVIPKRTAHAHTTKPEALVKPILGYIQSQGDRMVGKHFRFAVDITWICGRIEVWEEWQMEEIRLATPDQLNRFGSQLPEYLQGESNNKNSQILSSDISPTS